MASTTPRDIDKVSHDKKKYLLVHRKRDTLSHAYIYNSYGSKFFINK